MHGRKCLQLGVLSALGRRTELWGGLERRNGSGWQHGVPGMRAVPAGHTEREERTDGLMDMGTAALAEPSFAVIWRMGY